mgnify:CR=1 FL=1
MTAADTQAAGDPPRRTARRERLDPELYLEGKCVLTEKLPLFDRGALEHPDVFGALTPEMERAVRLLCIAHDCMDWEGPFAGPGYWDHLGARAQLARSNGASLQAWHEDLWRRMQLVRPRSDTRAELAELLKADGLERATLDVFAAKTNTAVLHVQLCVDAKRVDRETGEVSNGGSDAERAIPGLFD